MSDPSNYDSLKAIMARELQENIDHIQKTNEAAGIYDMNFDDPFDDFMNDQGPTKEAQVNNERFKTHSCQEFANLQTNGYFIKGILPRAELAMIYGPPGCGKSFATLDMVMAVARNMEWCGRRVKGGKVTYICAEAPSGFKNRIFAYMQKHSLTDVPDLNIITDVPNMLRLQDVNDLVKQIGKADIIVIDTLSRTLVGGDENQNRDMGIFIAHCQLINRLTGALVVLVHHSGKDVDKGSRGWSGLLGAVDTEIKIEQFGIDRKLTITKQKDGESGDVLGFYLNPVVLGIDEDEEDITSCVFEHMQVMPNQKSKEAALGGVQKIIMDCIALIPERPIMMEDLTAMVIASIPHDASKEDQRRNRFFRSLERLQTAGTVSIANNLVYVN